MNNSNFQRKVSDIIPPSKSRTEVKKQLDIEKPVNIHVLPPRPKKQKLSFRNWKMLFIISGILFIYIFSSLIFSKIKFDLTPKSALLLIDETVEFSKNPRNSE